MQTITSMMKKLKKAYPKTYITIEKRFGKHSVEDNFKISYYLYIAEITHKPNLTYQELITAVKEVLALAEN